MITGTTHGLSENDCGNFYTVPENKHDFTTIPVLILKQNSTGCAKITFTIDHMYDDTRFSTTWPQMATIGDTFHVGKYNYTTNGNQYSTASHDAANSFHTLAVPSVVDLSKYPVGSNFTIIYVIKPLANATGFYDYSIPRLTCNAYPLAVGYSRDQVNSSDFSKGLEGMLVHSCFNFPYKFTAVEIAGMNYTEMKLP